MDKIAREIVAKLRANVTTATRTLSDAIDAYYRAASAEAAARKALDDAVCICNENGWTP